MSWYAGGSRPGSDHRNESLEDDVALLPTAIAAEDINDHAKLIPYYSQVRYAFRLSIETSPVFEVLSVACRAEVVGVEQGTGGAECPKTFLHWRVGISWVATFSTEYPIMVFGCLSVPNPSTVSFICKPPTFNVIRNYRKHFSTSNDWLINFLQ